MTTSKQRAANQKNGRRSGGPKTEDGKAVSRMNAVVTGLTGLSPTIPGESEEEMIDFVLGVMTELDPDGPLEEEIARDIALCLWRLRRAHRAEAGLYQHWLLVERPERLDKEHASRPRITPELLKRVGYKEPPPPSEEDLQKWEEQARQKQHATLGEAVSLDSASANALQKLARYEAALSRRIERGLHTLRVLQSENQPALGP